VEKPERIKERIKEIKSSVNVENNKYYTNKLKIAV
jgi:hypothetical protein